MPIMSHIFSKTSLLLSSSLSCKGAPLIHDLPLHLSHTSYTSRSLSQFTAFNFLPVKFSIFTQVAQFLTNSLASSYKVGHQYPDCKTREAVINPPWCQCSSDCKV